MRFHTDTLTYLDLREAALKALAYLDASDEHGSRKRDHAWEVKLTGHSRRRPNGGTYGSSSGIDDHAATWDQWGVFIAELFARDNKMTTTYYASAEEYAHRTGDRFGAPTVTMDSTGYVERFVSAGWPEDAHGDHTFRASGRHGVSACTKCSAVQVYTPLPTGLSAAH